MISSVFDSSLKASNVMGSKLAVSMAKHPKVASFARIPAIIPSLATLERIPGASTDGLIVVFGTLGLGSLEFLR